MRVINIGLMELAHDEASAILSVKWADELSVESEEFFQTVVSLFEYMYEKQVENLVIDSGIPAGGVLNERIIDVFIQNIPNTPLKNILLLESPDYLWDNNLYQVIKLLVTSYQLPIAVELMKNKADAHAWLLQSLVTSCPRTTEN
ncbi:hypothetical protein ABID22_000291 [Pontibacter aydingkolensis]|uniref:SpoIIAA-like n=1 Tax=Pontibacter aydingkolensis TaxID=1911536 RepID=A0ABS7CQI8_9BACT|nr:hypothetical protein [Pontibacter aydingkolensis]MBW7466043.1 hypothetical protein [Pontibacter aydingkolensis]